MVASRQEYAGNAAQNVNWRNQISAPVRSIIVDTVTEQVSRDSQTMPTTKEHRTCPTLPISTTAR
jgi:hypothetical protein